MTLASLLAPPSEATAGRGTARMIAPPLTSARLYLQRTIRLNSDFPLRADAVPGLLSLSIRRNVVCRADEHYPQRPPAECAHHPNYHWHDESAAPIAMASASPEAAKRVRRSWEVVPAMAIE